MLILGELAVAIAYGLFHLFEQLAVLIGSLFMVSPEVAGPSYAQSRSAVVQRLLSPVRTAARHPARVALAIGAVAIGIATFWRP